MSLFLILITTLINTCLCANDNIIITNVGNSNTSYYACSISNLSPGYTLTTVEIRMVSNHWFTCANQPPAHICSVSSPLPNATQTAVSIRLSSIGPTSDEFTITGYGRITSFEDGLTFDFGSNFLKEVPTPIPTRQPITTQPTISPTNRPTLPTDTGKIIITNRAGSTSFWYTIVISGISNKISIDKVYMQHAEIMTWIEGTYYRWGNYWAFNMNGPFVPPFSFKMVSSNGQVIESDDVINSLAANVQGEMDETFSLHYGKDDSGTGSWGIWLAIVFIIVIVCCVVIGTAIYKKNKGKSKQYRSDTLELNETDVNKNKAMEQKKEFETIDTGNTGGNVGDAMMENEVDENENDENNDEENDGNDVTNP